MSEINLQFSVNTYSASFTSSPNPIVINPVTNNLMMFTGFAAYPPAGGNGNGQVTFNDAGLFSGSNNFTYANSTNTLTVQNIVANSMTSSGNVTIGNISSTGNVAVANNTTTANLTVNSYSNLGNLPNITIGGGANGQFIKTDGTGNLSFATIPSGGSNMQLQFNSAGALGGIPSVTWNGVKLALGNVANLKIDGGTNGYVLQTDGTGNLTWQAQAGNVTGNGSPGGANTQIQYNRTGVFGGSAGFTYDNSSNTLTVTNANVVGNLTANVISATTISTTGGGLSVANLTASGNITSSANIYANSGNIKGNILIGNYIYGDGSNITNISASNISGTVANANYAAYAGNITIAAQSNITSLGSLTGLTVTGTTKVQQAKEKVTISGTTPSGTINYDALTQSILYYTGNASGNMSLNVRGNSSTTFNSITSTGESMTLVLMTTVGATVYTPTTLTVDGVTTTPKWISNVTPNNTTVLANTLVGYSYTLIKTGTSTYTVLASFTGYK